MSLKVLLPQNTEYQDLEKALLLAAEELNWTFTLKPTSQNVTCARVKVSLKGRPFGFFTMAELFPVSLRGSTTVTHYNLYKHRASEEQQQMYTGLVRSYLSELAPKEESRLA